MVTPGTPDKPDGPRIRLQQEDASMSMIIVAPGKTAGWQIIDSSKPRNEWDSPNRGTRTVAFEAIAPASGRLILIVLCTPGSCQNSVAGALTIRPLEKWGS
jgi:hypothetical protein